MRDPPRQKGRRAVVAIGALAAGTALAIGIAMAIHGGSSAEKRSTAAALEAPPASPVAQNVRTVPEPPPAPVARPEPTSGAREKRIAKLKPARFASVAPAPAPGPTEDSFALPSGAFVSAGPVDPRCVPRALKARRDLAGRLPTEIAVRFPVAASGTVGRIEVLGEVSDGEVAAAVQNAIRGCPFNAGSDEDGRPAKQSVTMRIKFPR